MNKSELVASIAEKSGLTKKDAEQALNGFISSVQETCLSSDLSNFESSNIQLI
ncbi:DNA-binding protein HU [Peptoniphilus harei]|uniref:DNA-binding protein HU n=1 Tax=Peptoniphilus harei TaxID=54005 RepID=A0A2X1X3I9_9FIRM|nr:DNA-binding protein HU [Peptoniphilus harei]